MIISYCTMKKYYSNERMVKSSFDVPFIMINVPVEYLVEV
jgi:hypothetical protein